MKWTRLTYLLMPAAIVMAFLYAPPARGLGEASRILYFHVPLAWVSVLAFAVSGLFSVMFLAGKGAGFRDLPLRARHSAELGFLFTLLATVGGSVWSYLSWGAYWNWDPRQTSIVVLLLIYTAYFSLDQALRDRDGRERLVSAYLIFAMATMPFFVFVAPRVFPSLHPNPIINPDRHVYLEAPMIATLLLSIAAYTFLYAYLMDLRARASALARTFEEEIR